MLGRLKLGGEVHPLKLGKSFDRDSRGNSNDTAFHSVRYDFKPASVDTSQVASLEIGERDSVSVVLPHVEGSGTKSTVYKGNKRPSQKDCVLIIDNKTGEITLERLTSNIQLKKTRTEGSSRGGQMPVGNHPRPATPTEKARERKTSPGKKKDSAAPTAATTPQPSSSQQSSSSVKSSQSSVIKKSQPEANPKSPLSEVGTMSDSTSDTDSSSSEDEAPSRTQPTPVSSQSAKDRQPSSNRMHSVLVGDLQLSSDSDSD